MVKKDVYTKIDYQKGGAIGAWLMLSAFMIAAEIGSVTNNPIFGSIVLVITVASFTTMCLGRGRWLPITSGAIHIIIGLLGFIVGYGRYAQENLGWVIGIGASAFVVYGIYTIALCFTNHTKRYFISHKLVDELDKNE